MDSWKEDCDRNNSSCATLPKKVFPSLLKALLEKDFGSSIISGFETTGIYPFNPDKVLCKLPEENAVVESQIQQQLLERLKDLRYNVPGNVRTARAKKKDKLPAGASYTCNDGQMLLNAAVDADKEMEEMSRRRRSAGGAGDVGTGTGEDSDIEDEPQKQKQKGKQRALVWEDNDSSSESSSNSSEEEEEEETGREIPVPVESDQESELDMDDQYLPGVYVVAVYQGKWYVGLILEKQAEERALPGKQYLYVSYMERLENDTLKWPVRPDKLNTLRGDVLFVCKAPTPSHGTSSSRSISYTLSKDDLKTASYLFDKAYYHTIKCLTPFFVCVLMLVLMLVVMLVIVMLVKVKLVMVMLVVMLVTLMLVLVMLFVMLVIVMLVAFLGKCLVTSCSTDHGVIINLINFSDSSKSYRYRYQYRC